MDGGRRPASSDHLKLLIRKLLVHVVVFVVFCSFMTITGLWMVPFVPVLAYICIHVEVEHLFFEQAGSQNVTSANAASSFVELGLTDAKRFRLTDQCQLVLLKGDITKWRMDGRTDAIVKPTHPSLLERSEDPLDEAIYAAAGRELLQAAVLEKPELEEPIVEGEVIRCRQGQATITSGFDLPVAHIIHTVGPDCKNFEHFRREGELLTAAYRNSCALAISKGVQYVAFSTISCGLNMYSVKEAAIFALQAVSESCGSLKEVHFVFRPCLPGHYSWTVEAERQRLKLIE